MPRSHHQWQRPTEPVRWIKWRKWALNCESLRRKIPQVLLCQPDARGLLYTENTLLNTTGFPQKISMREFNWWAPSASSHFCQSLQTDVLLGKKKHGKAGMKNSKPQSGNPTRSSWLLESHVSPSAKEPPNDTEQTSQCSKLVLFSVTQDWFFLFSPSTSPETKGTEKNRLRRCVQWGNLNKM